MCLETTMSNEAMLAGKSAVVTGASSGIGRAIAERLGLEGVFVVLAGREKLALEESASKINAAGGTSVVVVADIRDAGSVQNLVDIAVNKTGQLDIFVNNAGVSFLGTIADGDPESWRSMLDTNVLSLLIGCQAAVRSMRAKGNHGHIVNISSVAALNPDSGVYGATKHAVNVITNTLRLELLEDPIQVTSIMPGLAATNIGRNVDPAILEGVVAMSGIDAVVAPGERLPDDVLEAAQEALSDFIIKPDDVADAVFFVLTRPGRVHIPEIVIRPNKDFDF
jgi:NADP-dependent 3-hydroxy acid dehydrogenase YdfG